MERTIQSAGVEICYTDEGTGAPVVLIHGFAAGAAMWEQAATLSALRDQFRVISVDCRGHGKSGKPQQTSAYGRQMVQDLRRLLDQLDIQKTAVVGYSMGAEIGLRLAVEYPDRVRALVLGGSGWSGAADTHNYQLLADSLEASASFGPIFRAMTPPGQPQPTAEEIAAVDVMLEGQNITALVSVARAMTDVINLSPVQISAIAIPVMGIVGEHDPERGNLEMLQGALPGYKLAVLAGRDHMSALADPEFNTSIVEFLVNAQ